MKHLIVKRLRASGKIICTRIRTDSASGFMALERAVKLDGWKMLERGTRSSILYRTVE